MLPAFTRELLPLVLHTKILPAISTLQRTMDAYDIEGLVRLWNLQSTDDIAPPIATGAPQPSMDEWISFAEEYLATDARPSYALETIDTPAAKGRLRYYMMAYLMSATLKDCSVIIHLGSTAGDRITVIDLDPKKIEKLRSWELQDIGIVRGFKESLEKGMVGISPCEDAGFRI